MTLEPTTEPPNPPPLARWGGRVLLIALAVLVVSNALWMSGTFRTLRPRNGGAPDFTVRRIDAAAGQGGQGVEFHLLAERGHPVLVDFWATWCGPCRESLPILDGVYAELKDRGLRAIAIEIEGAETKARAFAAQLHLNMPLGSDEGEVSSRYGVTQIPYMVLIDADGRIKRVFRGVHSAAEIKRAVEEAGLR
ncbi:MAG: TlpA disulfide reductase family protein [Polyangia bacterium]